MLPTLLIRVGLTPQLNDMPVARVFILDISMPDDATGPLPPAILVVPVAVMFFE